MQLRRLQALFEKSKHLTLTVIGELYLKVRVINGNFILWRLIGV